jgi:hypothetical protein
MSGNTHETTQRASLRRNGLWPAAGGHRRRFCLTLAVGQGGHHAFPPFPFPIPFFFECPLTIAS